jgi:hypothetical protein
MKGTIIVSYWLVGIVVIIYFSFKHTDERHSLALKYDAYNLGLALRFNGYVLFLTSRSDFLDELRQEFEKIRSRTFWYVAAPTLFFFTFFPVLAVIVRYMPI